MRADAFGSLLLQRCAAGSTEQREHHVMYFDSQETNLSEMWSGEFEPDA